MFISEHEKHCLIDLQLDIHCLPEIYGNGDLSSFQKSPWQTENPELAQKELFPY